MRAAVSAFHASINIFSKLACSSSLLLLFSRLPCLVGDRLPRLNPPTYALYVRSVQSHDRRLNVTWCRSWCSSHGVALATPASQPAMHHTFHTFHQSSSTSRGSWRRLLFIIYHPLHSFSQTSHSIALAGISLRRCRKDFAPSLSQADVSLMQAAVSVVWPSINIFSQARFLFLFLSSDKNNKFLRRTYPAQSLPASFLHGPLVTEQWP